jgi:DDE superfamily endonuclease
MATGRQSCQESQPAGGKALGELAGFRREMFWCLWRRPDALFELADAVLTAATVPSLPYLSLEPGFRRGHGMIYQSLAEGGIDEDALRDLLVRWRPRDWPLVFAIDASTYPRPWAQTSPGREWHHHACPGSHGKDGAAVAGWAFQWLAQLSFTADSWTAPQDQVQAGAGDDATRQAARQIVAHSARLRADGETRIPLYVHDAGYDEAPLTWDLRDHLHEVQVLVRLRNDRVLYRDPPPRIPGRPGRPRKHGSGADRFECKNPATWGSPDQELSLHDDRYGQVSVMSWSGLHPKLFCRGRFAGFAEPPVIKCHLIRVTVTRLPNGRKVPGPLWLWRAGPGAPDLDLIWRAYLHRFDIEHTYLPARQEHPGLGQGRAPRPGSGLPLDLAHHRRDYPVAPGPARCRRPPATLGTPPQARETHTRPGPPGFSSPDRAGRHPGQPAKTLQGRPRTPQRANQHPSNQASRPQESRLTSRKGLKRKKPAQQAACAELLVTLPATVAGCSA